MSLFQFFWLRKLVRRYTKPIAQDNAELWKRRLSIFYMIAAWNAFGLIGYAIYNGKADWAKYHGLSSDEGTPAQQWTKTLGIKDATVYRVSGFNVQKYEIHNESKDGDSQTQTTDEEVLS